MINATFTGPAVTAEPPDGTGRTIRGVAVPWDQVGTVADGTRVRFAPGALDAAELPIVTLGHDGPPIGRTAANVSTPAGMETTVRVSRVRDGDEALILAADGVLGMFSVGVNPTDWAYDDDGVMVVAAGDWHHTALLPFGAFAAARVADVTAAAPIPEPTGEPAMPDTLTTDDTPPDVEAAAPPSGTPAVIPVSQPREPAPALTLSRIANMVAAANRGEITTAAVRATLNAALANVTTTGIGGSIVPAYRSEIAGLINHGTPLLNALNQRPLPESGMTIEYPAWTATPTTGVQATEKTAITSTAATVALKSDPVKTIAGGNDISMQAIERSSGSFMTSYLEAASADWARKAEAEVITALLAGAAAATPGASFVANVQAMFAALNPATTPPGPLFLAMAYNVAVPLIGVTGLNGPAFWEASFDFGQMVPTLDSGSMPFMFVDWNLPVDTMLLGARNGASYYQSPGAPADIRVVDVSLLGVDVGVYGYIALAIEYPGAFVKMDITP